MKKILSIVLAALIATGVVTAYAVEVEPEGAVAMADGDLQVGDSFVEGDLKYIVRWDGTLEVSCPSDKKGTLTQAVIPSEVNGKSVTSIGYDAFYGCTSLTTVTIPDSVTSIDWGAFKDCTSLTTVTIPDSVIFIDEYAFSGCTSLATMTIPDSVISIDLRAFYGCTSLTTVTIPDSVISIGRLVFENCTSLTAVTIPDSVTSIAMDAFYGCTNLTAIDVDAQNAKYSSENGVLFNKNKTTLIRYPVGIIDKSYTIPDSVISIGGAFSGCTSLTTVTIPNSVTSIGGGAFSGCTSLTTVTIPNSVISIDPRAFYGCWSLESVTFNGTMAEWNEIEIGYDNDRLTNADITCNDGVINQRPFVEDDLKYTVLKDGTLEVSCPDDKKDTLTQAVIPSEVNGKSVTSVGRSAFWNCTGLTTVTIPDSVTNIGDGAFGDCTSLTTVTIPDSVTSIGNSAFSRCTSLTTVTIPDSVTSIGDWAFGDCTSLTTVTIPDSVTSIGDWAFGDCTSLTTVTIPDSVTSIGSSAFSSCTSLTAIDVEAQNADYSSENGVLFNKDKTVLIQYPIGKTNANYTIPDSVTNIGTWAFSGCDLLESVTIPDSVTSIGDDAFRECRSLTSVTVGNSVTSIGDQAFLYCSSLTSVTIGSGVTSIGYFTFFDGCSLTSVTFNGTMAEWNTIEIDDYGNDVLKTVEIICTDGIINHRDPEAGNSFIEGDLEYTVLYDGTLEVSCPSDKKDALTQVIIPSEVNERSVTSIGASAFSHCDSLTSVTIPDSVTVIGGSAFRVCSSLTSVTIPNSVTSIGDSAFRDCSSLTSVTIPNSVTSIGDSVFRDCSSLTSVSIPDSVTRIYDYAFLNCSSLTSVMFPDSIASIGRAAFMGCSSLESVAIPDSVTSIGDYAFDGCSLLEGITVALQNKKYSSVDGVLFNKDKTKIVRYPAGKNDTSYEIPDSVTSIDNDVFNVCSSLESVTIPDSVTSIGRFAFEGCSSLTSVTIPDSVTSIEWGTFSGCISLTTMTIPDDVTSIGKEAFSGCTSLTTLMIPDDVTSIGEDAFSGCTSLTTMTIPDSVTSIGNYAFNGCSSLEEIEVGLQNEEYSSVDGVLFNKYQTEIIRYPAGKKNTSYEIPDSVTSIGRFAFEGCSSLTSVTIPDSVTSIEWGTFSGCISLTTLMIPDDVTSIGDEAFSGCSSLTSVTIPDSVTKIGSDAFNGCSSLEEIEVGLQNKEYSSVDGVLFNKYRTMIGNGALFYKYQTEIIRYPAGKKDTSYEIPDSVTRIVAYAFEGCSSLTSVTIPDSVTVIGTGTFSGCTSLKDVYYSGTEEQWQAIIIYDYNDNLTNATIHFKSNLVTAPVEIKIPKPETGAPEITNLQAQSTVNGETLTLPIDADGNLDISEISDGDYTFTFSAKNCAPRAYAVTVSNGSVSGLEDGVELHLYGDIDGDGKVNMKDVGKANAHAKNTAKLSDYDLSVSDINGDGKINMQDVGLMNAHAKNTKSLW